MFGLSKYVIIALAALSAIGGFAGWRWLEVRETLAVERAQYERDRAQFEAERTQFQNQERIAREASNAYQQELAAVRSNADALLADNRGLRLVAYRAIPAVSITAQRLDPASPEPERTGGVEIDLDRLTRLAERCESDAAQLDALIEWTRSLNASR